MITFSKHHSAYLLILLSISCARINQPSKNYHEAKQMRHGIIPLSSRLVQKLEAASIERGKIIYQKHCLSCHGVNGEGDGAFAPRIPRPVNLRKLAHEVRDFKFFMSISEWQGDMPGWKEPMNENEKEDLTSYIKSLRTGIPDKS